jgi:hypothetical protein
MCRTMRVYTETSVPIFAMCVIITELYAKDYGKTPDVRFVTSSLHTMLYRKVVCRGRDFMLVFFFFICRMSLRS